MTTVFSSTPEAVPPRERDALLARLAGVEAAHQALTTENRRLALRVQDLEAQLRIRWGVNPSKLNAYADVRINRLSLYERASTAR